MDLDLIELARDHFFSEDFQAELDAFIATHCRPFAAVTDEQLALGRDIAVEHDMALWSTYLEFQALFEAKIESFLSARDTTVQDFFEVCKVRSADAADCGGASQFIDLLLATSDYGSFLLLMREEGADALENDEGKQHE